MNICPAPNCGHVFEVLTRNHCETEHHLPRDILLKKYGPIKQIQVIPNRLKQNMKGFNPITASKFIR